MHYPENSLSSPTTTATATGTVEPTSTATETATPTPTGTPTPATQVTYTYDGDGNLVMSQIGSTVTFYPNMYYEIQGTTIIKYYFAAGKRIAMRQNDTVTFLLADHLGSTSVTTDSTGVLVSSILYTAFGETRTSTGMTASDYLYTGQREESEIGLYFYTARFYDAYLNRFISADTIIPEAGDPLAWDRYAYARNNPLRFIDPSGNYSTSPCLDGEICGTDPIRPSKTYNYYYLTNVYGWRFDSIYEWSSYELKLLVQVADDYRSFLDGKTNNQGKKLMDRYLSPFFHHRKSSKRSYTHGYVVNLYNGWEKNWHSLIHLSHEISHILDYETSKYTPLPATIFGGGWGDELFDAMGGDLGLPRFLNNTNSILEKNRFDIDDSFDSTYAMHSTADYFASVISLSIYRPEIVPQNAYDWLTIKLSDFQ